MRLFFVLLLFPAMLVFGQSQEIDSVKSALNNVSNDSIKVDLLFRLARAYQYHSLVDLERYASAAIDRADMIGYEKGKADGLPLLSGCNTFRGFYDLGLEQQHRAVQIFER